MSFLNSLQEYVSNGVANLSIRSKRFTLNRTDSDQTSTNNATASTSSIHATPGFPKVVPSATASLQSPMPSASSRRSSVFDLPPTAHQSNPLTLSPSPSLRRQNSQRQQQQQQQQSSGATLASPAQQSSQLSPFNQQQQQQRRKSSISAGNGPLIIQSNTVPTSPLTGSSGRNFNFCSRRPSWTEIDNQPTNEVTDSDNGYFENFISLAWQYENQKQTARKTAEKRAKQKPQTESDLAIASIDYTLPPKESDSLYLDMLYTIMNSVGAPAPGGQFSHFKDDLFAYGQRAFRMPADKHYHLLRLSGNEKPPIIVLSIVVVEAEGLEAKDANGFSDPYCMLGILPKEDLPTSFSDNSTDNSLSAAASGGGGGGNSFGSGEQSFRKNHSFRLSFKRKEQQQQQPQQSPQQLQHQRSHRDSINSLLPAKFIQTTTVKPQTLYPKWNEKFRFDIDDLNSDSLHLDIWDHDDESSVFDAASKLNEVRNVRGLGRYFKQICQSARQNSQDDFLGCVTIPLKEIPSTGLESWFKLEARSNRSTVQGRIRLKLWLSTREENQTKSTSGQINDGINWCEMLQHEKLCMIFIDYELSIFGQESYAWNGELSGEALTILHQHAVQSDLVELQRMMCLWMAVSKVCLKHSLNFRWILKLLSDLDHLWPTINLAREDENWLAQSFNAVLDRWFQLLAAHRQLFPVLYPQSLHRFEFLLKCFAFIANMKAYWKCCPFNKEIHGEMIAALRKGTIDYFLKMRSVTITSTATVTSTTPLTGTNSVAFFLIELYAYLDSHFTYYNSLFDEINRIPYFGIVFKQIDLLLVDEIDKFLKLQEPISSPDQIKSIFLLYFIVKDFLLLNQNIDHKLQLMRSIDWFQPFIEYWIKTSRSCLFKRVEAAIKFNKETSSEKSVKYSSSTVDVVSTMCNVRDFWLLLNWPKSQSILLVGQLVEMFASASIHYGDILSKKLQGLHFSGATASATVKQQNTELCVIVNNMQYVSAFLSNCYQYFEINALESIAMQQQQQQQQPQINYNLISCQLNRAIDDLQNRICNTLKNLAKQMQISLKKFVFHIAWSPDSLPTEQAVEPLFEYLCQHLQALNLALLPANFQTVLFQIWELTLIELNEQLDASEKSEEKLTNFYDRLYAALLLCADFFEADSFGLTGDLLRNQLFSTIENRMNYFRMSTDSLIDCFYKQRLQEQLQTVATNYGTLAVRVHFSHDSLCVEILYAKDVIPLDPNGFSDPFVIIELLPKRIFPNCNEQQTNVHKKTLNPVFDECFEFSVTWEQCRTPGSLIAFTVMDYDVITANDFAGEAFLSLENTSGLCDFQDGIDNFHGLKIVELPLLQFHDKNDPILVILESRTTDRQAVEFLKKQKLKMSN